MDNPVPRQLFKETSCGSGGSFGLEILVDTKLLNLNQGKIRDATYHAAALIKSEIMAAVLAGDSEAKARTVEERRQLLALFPSQIYVEEIPNGYCSDWCCRHLPWFSVTTRIGKFEIGWRKRIISIDWSATQCQKTAEELFPDDDVTKTGRLIHAWSLENAKRYIETVALAVPMEA